MVPLLLVFYGGQRWSRTTVLGFSDRRANRVRHLPIFYFQDTMFVLQNVGLEPTTYCLSDNCSPI